MDSGEVVSQSSYLRVAIAAFSVRKPGTPPCSSLRDILQNSPGSCLWVFGPRRSIALVRIIVSGMMRGPADES